jgi:hypothetical protein
MKEATVVRMAAVAALAVAAYGCAEGPEPLGIQTDGLTPGSPAAAVNARRLDAPVWEAILSPVNPQVGPKAVTGKAVLTMEDGLLTVRLDVRGVVAGHAGESTCPTPQADSDGDGLVSVGEGAPDYGPVMVPLTPFPAPEGSTYHYEQTFENQGDLEPARRAIVVHGAFVDGTYEGSLPVACGTIDRVR